MLDLKIEVFAFSREGIKKTLYSVSTEIDEGLNVDIPCIVRTLRLLYPKSSGVMVTFL